TLTEDHETGAEPEAKRRKTRKGTHSCWECRRQKLKCIFSAPTDTICFRCQQRNTKCVSQEFPEEVSAPVERTRRMGDRVVRVEALVEQLVKKVGSHNDGTAVVCRTPASEDGGNPRHGIPTPVSTVESDSSRFLALYKPSKVWKYEKLSRLLYDSLPTREDTEMIYSARGHSSMLFHEVWTIPYTILDQGDQKWSENKIVAPGPKTHPVIIARYMLHLAVFLQHIPPEFHKEARGLSESPRTIMKRLVDMAIGLVTTNDELIGSIEGLECVMMESLYQSNTGNLRRSWIAIRRALVIAQLMGLPRRGSRAQYKFLDPKTKADPLFMWFRIVFHDRHLCLMLGLQQGCLDHSMTSDAMMASETPVGRLERMHCVLASRILQRNESDPSCRDFDVMRDLDMELQKVTRILPNKWWLVPDLARSMSDSHALFWDMRRLFVQLFHYNLLNQLHLPYMLRSSDERKYDYSRITCVNASREILSRFVMFRSFNQSTFCCRMVDFFALMAAMTLLLALIDSHRSSSAEKLLAHQYLTDRAMIEQAQENMEEVNRLNTDLLSAQGADLLRRLLAIEAEAADGHMYRAEGVSVQVPESELAQSEEDNISEFRMYIPYFGTIKIARDGVISKKIPAAEQLLGASSNNSQLPITNEFNKTTPEIRNSETRIYSSSYAQPYANIQPQLPASSPGNNSVAAPFMPQLSGSISDTLLQQPEYPVLAADVDNWAFQGVDMAFFDSLMRG
ncbi:hypothetical protein BGW36DRAFT_263745, partial [Talaromyces proteolyticus]